MKKIIPAFALFLLSLPLLAADPKDPKGPNDDCHVDEAYVEEFGVCSTVVCDDATSAEIEKLLADEEVAFDAYEAGMITCQPKGDPVDDYVALCQGKVDLSACMNCCTNASPDWPNLHPNDPRYPARTKGPFEIAKCANTCWKKWKTPAQTPGSPPGTPPPTPPVLTYADCMGICDTATCGAAGNGNTRGKCGTCCLTCNQSKEACMIAVKRNDEDICGQNHTIMTPPYGECMKKAREKYDEEHKKLKEKDTECRASCRTLPVRPPATPPSTPPH